MPDGPGYSVITEPPATWCDLDSWNPAELPPRPWVAKGYLLRGAVTMIAGAGGVSKSGLTLLYAVAGAMQFEVGGFRPNEAFRSVVYNVEDDLTEQRRRLSAIAMRHSLNIADFAPMIARTGPERIGMLFKRNEHSDIEQTAALEELEALVVSTKASVLWVDPLAELHGEDENDNNAMRTIVASLRRMAKRLHIAVVIIHHTRKGVLIPGDIDAARGAGAIGGAVRVGLTVVAMSEEEEKGLGLAAGTRRNYFRVDGGKANYSALTGCEWFEKHVYHLPGSDEQVSVPVLWLPPVDLITPDTLAAVADAIARGSPFGPWSPKLERRPRSITNAMMEAGITTAPGQEDVLARLVSEYGIKRVPYKDANCKWVAGLRAEDGRPSNVTWKDGGGDDQ